MQYKLLMKTQYREKSEKLTTDVEFGPIHIDSPYSC